MPIDLNPLYPRNPLPRPIAAAADVERFARLFERMGVWECPVCRELYPPCAPDEEHLSRPLGVCLDCLISNENLETDDLKMPSCDRDAFMLYAKLLRGADISKRFGPHGNPHGDQREPVEFEILRLFIAYYGNEEMRELIKRERPHSNSAFTSLPRAFVDPDTLRWSVEYGYCPVSVPYGELPAKDDRKAWEALRKPIWVID